MLLYKYEIIILDCDGVVFDSNLLKINAFRKVLEKYDKKIVDSFIEYFKNNFGISRYNLAQIFIEEFLKIEFDKKLNREILTSYSEQCVFLYKNSNVTKNFFNFIDNYKDKMIYIASGSDQKELREVFKQRGIDKYFKEIYGSPKKKSDIIKDIVSFNDNAVMIGDAKSDMFASKENGIDFIFMKDYSTNKDMKNNNSLVTINNLGDLI